MTTYDSSLDTVKQLIDGAIEDVDDTDTSFKLRTASQLVDAIEHHEESLSETLDTAPLDDDVESDLRDMGYIN